MFWRRGNYEFNTVEDIVSHVTHMKTISGGHGLWVLRPTRVSSLKSHQIATDNQMSSSFVCWDIPFESAKICKAVC